MEGRDGTRARDNQAKDQSAVRGGERTLRRPFDHYPLIRGESSVTSIAFKNLAGEGTTMIAHRLSFVNLIIVNFADKIL